MGWSMDAQATSPAGHPAIDPEPQAPGGSGPTHPGSVPTNPGGSVPAHPGTTASPAGMEAPAEPRSPGFRERGRMRRRVRFLRKARELAYRDLGGLVFEMHRMGQRHDELVAAKLSVLASFDGELRTLEAALGERQPLTVLRETGIAACPRCAAIHGSYDHFCPVCGMPMGRHADRPIAATPAVVAGAPPAAVDAGAARPALTSPSASAAAASPAQPSPSAPSTTGAPQRSTPQPPASQPSTPQRSTPQPSAPRPSASQPSTPQPSVPPRPASQPSTPQPSAPRPPASQQSTPQRSTPEPRAPRPPTSQPPAPRRAAPAATEEDEPTKIIRPQDDAK